MVAAPLRSDEQSCRAALHLEEGWQGRECRPGQGVEGCGGDTAHSVNPAHKSSQEGIREREARSDTSEEEP